MEQVIVMTDHMENTSKRRYMLESKARLEWSMEIVEKTLQNDDVSNKKKVKKAKKCNFFNRGYCSKGEACEFQHPGDVCEVFQTKEGCIEKYCSKRHLYDCKLLKDKGECFRGEKCAFNHQGVAKDSLEVKEVSDAAEDVLDDHCLERKVSNKNVKFDVIGHGSSVFETEAAQATSKAAIEIEPISVVVDRVEESEKDDIEQFLDEYDYGHANSIDREALEEFMDEYDKNGIDTIDSKSSDKGKATKKGKKKRAIIRLKKLILDIVPRSWAR